MENVLFAIEFCVDLFYEGVFFANDLLQVVNFLWGNPLFLEIFDFLDESVDVLLEGFLFVVVLLLQGLVLGLEYFFQFEVVVDIGLELIDNLPLLTNLCAALHELLLEVDDLRLIVDLLGDLGLLGGLDFLYLVIFELFTNGLGPDCFG